MPTALRCQHRCASDSPMLSEHRCLGLDSAVRHTSHLHAIYHQPCATKLLVGQHFCRLLLVRRAHIQATDDMWALDLWHTGTSKFKRVR